jgi:hypothetical protein
MFQLEEAQSKNDLLSQQHAELVDKRLEMEADLAAIQVYYHCAIIESSPNRQRSVGCVVVVRRGDRSWRRSGRC